MGEIGMTKQSPYEETLKYLWEEYLIAINNIASSVFDNEIKPWLDKYKLEFFSGMGGWWINATSETPKWFLDNYKDTHYNKKYYLDNDKLPDKIKNVLDSEIDGLPANNLGSMIVDYRQPGVDTVSEGES